MSFFGFMGMHVLSPYKDSIDCLEVEYESIASVQLQELLGEGASNSQFIIIVDMSHSLLPWKFSGIRIALHVMLSLSSPPILGLGPVLRPPKSDIKGHYVKFEIAVEDSEEFKAVLQARGMVRSFLL